jgi:alkanesulfonate monooxygenase SsuD/methylene tetrahydromethanopterin reductase-like flavin-dependent oxidoreductase (luciferase family)
VLEKHGDKYHPFRFGILMSTYVAETDKQAREECEEGVWYFLKNCLKGHLRREGRQLTFGPGVPYVPTAAWREYLKGYKPGRKLLGDVDNWEELDASQSIIVGSVETVTRRIQSLIERAKVGNLLIQFQLGNMPDHLARKSMKLFAEQVAPALRQASLRQFSSEYPGIDVEQTAEALH